jgi:hypothetical protein
VRLDIPRIGVVDLDAVGSELLLQVALAAGQRDEDHRQPEIGAGAYRVACQHAEAARIGVELRIKRNLHAEVGDSATDEERVQGRHCACPLAGG